MVTLAELQTRQSELVGKLPTKGLAGGLTLSEMGELDACRLGVDAFSGWLKKKAYRASQAETRQIRNRDNKARRQAEQNKAQRRG